MTEPNTSTVCHPYIEVGETAAEPAAQEPAEAVTYTVVYTDAEGTVYYALTTTDATVVPEPQKWTAELVEPNTGTVCRPTADVQKDATGMELYVLADGWLGCRVTLRDDETYEISYDYTEENSGIVTESGTWEKTNDNTIVLTSETGTETVLNGESTPTKEGYLFAGWQTVPTVTKDDLILGVSPYEVPLGASSLYGGAGVAITDYERMGDMLLLYARWVEPTEIHNAEELKAMAEDLSGWYVLANDIDLAGENWQPIGKYFSNYETVNAPYWTYAFRGTFDGAGYSIQNLTIDVDGCKADLGGFENAAVWRNDGESLGGEVAFFGATAKATIQNGTFDNAKITVASANDATPYVAVVNGFDLASTVKNVVVNNAVVTVTANDASMQQRTGTWAAVSAFTAGGWSTTIENCAVNDAVVTLGGTLTKAHGAEYYVGTMLGEGYAFMDNNSAVGKVFVDVKDESAAEADGDLIVNVGGMGGTNTTQTNGKFSAEIDVKIHKPVGAATVSIGGLCGSQRYQVAENNVIHAEITTDCTLDPENGKLYVGSVIGSTNVPYCIVQMIFAEPNDVAYSGCRNNETAVTHNGEAVTRTKGEVLTVGGEPFGFIANGDVTDEATGTVYASNINEVIAEYGSAVPSAFLQKCVIVLVNE